MSVIHRTNGSGRRSGNGQRPAPHRVRPENRFSPKLASTSLLTLEQPLGEKTPVDAGQLCPMDLRFFHGLGWDIKNAALLQLAQQLLYSSNGLLDALFVFHQGKAHEVIAVFSKTNAWADRDLGLFQKQFGKLQGTHGFESFGYFCPNKHGCFGLFNNPIDPLQTLAEGVSPAAVSVHDFLHAILRPAQSGNSGNLNRLKGSVIQVALNARQSVNDFAISGAEATAGTRSSGM